VALPVIAIVIGVFLLAQTRYNIEPGPVTGDRNSGINGSFKIVRAKLINLAAFPNILLRSNGIESDKTGGACIAFPAKELGFPIMGNITCTKNAECEPEQGVPPEGAGAYCEVKTKNCWSKPLGAEKALCNRSPDVPWTENVDHQIVAQPAPLSQISLPPDVHARVIACLLAKGTGAPCGKPNDLVRWGQETTIH
jgi:hypothetical protein